MKKQLSFALLTINLFTFNILPAKAVNTRSSNLIDYTEYKRSSESVFLIDGSNWCITAPWLFSVCF